MSPWHALNVLHTHSRPVQRPIGQRRRLNRMHRWPTPIHHLRLPVFIQTIIDIKQEEIQKRGNWVS